MLNLGFGSCKLYTDENTKSPGTVQIKGGVLEEISCSYKEKFCYLDTKGANTDSIQKKIHMKKTAEAPVKKGEKAGRADYYLDGKKIGSVDLVFDRNVKKAKYRDYLEKICKIFLQGREKNISEKK